MNANVTQISQLSASLATLRDTEVIDKGDLKEYWIGPLDEYWTIQEERCSANVYMYSVSDDGKCIIYYTVTFFDTKSGEYYNDSEKDFDCEFTIPQFMPGENNLAGMENGICQIVKDQFETSFSNFIND